MSSLDRGLDLLVTLERADRSMTLTELGRAANIHKATTQRLLIALERRGFVEKVRGQYQVGAAVVPLARAFLTENSLSKAGRVVLEQLTAASGETSSIFVRQGFDRVVIQRVDSPYPLRYSLQIGQRLPLYLGASGQVLAGAMSEDELDEMLSRAGDVHLSDGRVLTPSDEKARILDARLKGYAVSVSERTEGVVSAAVPVTVLGQGTIAALTIAGPSSRLSRDQAAAMVADLRRASDDLVRAFSRM